jgi:hypothetical protein
MKPAGRSRLFGVIVAAAAASAVAVVVAGCTSGGSSAASSATSASSANAAPGSASSPAASNPAVSNSAAPPAPASGPAGSTSPGNPGAAGTPKCATRSLQATVGLSQGAAGSIYQVIDFKNISGAPCTLYGYPGVSFAGGTPVTQIGAGAAREHASPTTVTLAAGATANALLKIAQAGNYAPADCHPVASTYIQIYPPDQTTPIYLAYNSTACAKTPSVPQLQISVMQPGSGSSGG